MNLQDYFQVEGFAYRFVPIKSTSSPQQMQFGKVATDLMYENLMNKFKWGEMNNPDIYIDENNMRMMTNIRNSFNRLATGLIEEGQKEKAVEVIDRCFELVPLDLVTPDYFAMELADSYYKAGANDKAKAILEKALEIYNDELGYYFSLNPKFIQTKSVNEELQRNLFYMQRMEQAARNSGDIEFATKISEAFQAHLNNYQAG